MMEFSLVKIVKMGGIGMLKYILLIFNKRAYLCDFFFTPT